MTSDSAFAWNLDTEILISPNASSAVRHAARMLRRDMEKTLSPGGAVASAAAPAAEAPSRIEAGLASPGDPIYGMPEAFSISFGPEGAPAGSAAGAKSLRLSGSDELGLVYGLLHLSRAQLGVDPFWYWMDREPAPIGEALVPALPRESAPFAVRYRGWFVNDEDSIIGWSDGYPPSREAWYPVFEALLRLGGNMVIPGTDLPRGGCHEELAAEMGLYVAQHHAEPLGAEMFKRAYPSLEARYDAYPELFERLWAEAAGRGRGRKTVWTLGFRGQGDKPFWEDDPAYDTDEKRGRLIGSIIARQARILRDADGDVPVCAYVYGELTDLYRRGYVELPDGVMRIWADNGYGRMVSRRQGNSNPRVPSLPSREDAGPHGLYYHIAFHDLQASNHLTMFPNPHSLIRDELVRAFGRGAKGYLLVNSANIRHQAFALDLAAELWRSGDADVEAHRAAFCARFFSSAAAEAGACLSAYPEATVRYGPNEDDRAGEELYHHCPRSLIAAWMRGEDEKGAEDMRWATGKVPLGEQFAFFRSRLEASLPSWVDLHDRAKRAASSMEKGEAERFRQYFIFQVRLHRSGCAAFIRLCDAYELFAKGEAPRAFVAATAALREYEASLRCLEEAQRGRWKNFFRCDYLTNVAATAYAADALRRWLRQFGDAPDYYRWNRAYAVSPSERGLLLENTTRRALSDDELADALSAAFARDGQEQP
jgi:hypothetical protein